MVLFVDSDRTSEIDRALIRIGYAVNDFDRRGPCVEIDRRHPDRAGAKVDGENRGHLVIW